MVSSIDVNPTNHDLFVFRINSICDCLIFFCTLTITSRSEVGYHRDKPTPEIVTPTIDALVQNGIDFNRHYVHMMVSKHSRAAQPSPAQPSLA
jgi:hypothetical protein